MNGAPGSAQPCPRTSASESIAALPVKAAAKNRCILREERNFVEIVDATFGRPSTLAVTG